jgi:hypothetical protein
MNPRKQARVGYALPLVENDVFQQVPQYMRGRLPVHKVNTTIEEINLFIQNKYSLLQQSSMKQNPTAMRKAQELRKYENSETKSLIHFTEHDLKEFKSIDATNNKSILAVLRHLHLLKECKVSGKEGWKYWVLQDGY